MAFLGHFHGKNVRLCAPPHWGRARFGWIFRQAFQRNYPKAELPNAESPFARGEHLGLMPEFAYGLQ